MTTATGVVRCAIYTRKSSEEGLDQAFNSLHAQREACEAYVMSQAGEGWTVLPTLYDDGGFSGGTIERPALKRLLADVAGGKVDTIIVYKIDRLTRALGDFARIVDQLDAAGASFVSVTQAFNTTTSMGRLTLNVLLSFAQFEREVTAERIRDKLAASKAKGMWMGGPLALGYDRPTDPITRALVVNETEAEIVRTIFRTYLELGSVSQLERWLDREAIRSKAYTTSRGRSVGGVRFSRGALFHLLKNRLYLGEIPHRDRSFPGAHPAIVPRELFETVQARLAANANERRERPTRFGQAALKGLIFDAHGYPMSPAFARGRGDQTYRYYVSAPLMQGRALPQTGGAIRRIPAAAVEEVVFDRLRRAAGLDNLGGDGAAGAGLLRRVEVHATSLHLVLDLSRASFGSRLDFELERIRDRLAPAETVEIEDRDFQTVRLSFPVRLQTRGGRTWVATPDGSDAVARTKVDRVLVRALRSAHVLASRLGHRPSAGPEVQAPVSAYDRKLCVLAFLAPDIQQAILEGRQPSSLTLQRLMTSPIPLCWGEQRAIFGFRRCL